MQADPSTILANVRPEIRDEVAYALELAGVHPGANPGANGDPAHSRGDAEPSAAEAAMAEACRIIGAAESRRPLLTLALMYVHLVNERARDVA